MKERYTVQEQREEFLADAQHKVNWLIAHTTGSVKERLISAGTLLLSVVDEIAVMPDEPR